MHEDVPALRFGELVPEAQRDRFDCFRDEVALDFPSLVPAVDRMCAAFLATDGASHALAAEVRLTEGEARAGGRVPVDLAVRRTCAVCGGRGEVQGEPCRPCDGCGDLVLQHQVHVSLPSGVRDGARFLLNVSPPRTPAVVLALHVSVG